MAAVQVFLKPECVRGTDRKETDLSEANKMIRIKFSKRGLMKYIGHLDTMRYFQKVMRRAEIDVAYSEGFSPHMIMSFAQPLSVGVESRGEYFDMAMKFLSPSSDLMERMNRVSAEGIEILDMVELPEKHKKAMASVYAASYSVIFRPGHEPDYDIIKAVESFNSMTELKIMKKSKKSVREIDLKELVYDLSAELKPCKELFPEGPLSGDIIDDPEKKVPVLKMTVSASSGDNVKPALLVRALKGIETELSPDLEYPGSTDLLITREEIFDSEMKALIEAGQRF